MFFEQSMVLIIICLVLNVVLTGIMYSIYRRHKADIEKLSTMLLICLTCGLIVFFVNILVPNITVYQIILVIIPFSLFFVVNVFFNLLERSGEIRPKRERILMYLYVIINLAVLLTLSLLNTKQVSIEGRIYFGVEEWTVIIPVVLLMIPEIYMAVISEKFFFKLYEKAIRVTFNLFLTIAFFYIITSYAIFFSLGLRTLAFYFLIASEIAGIIFLVKKHNFLAQIHSTFAYKSLYVIRNNGQTIYSHEFERIIDGMKDTKTIQYLIGGFIYAITHGIKEIIKEEYETYLRVMDFGKLKMLFYYGEAVFGVLFSKESNKVIYNRLEQFINQFEREFVQLSEDKSALSLLDGKELPETIYKKIEELLQVYFKF